MSLCLVPFFLLLLVKSSFSAYFFYEIYFGPFKVGESKIFIEKHKNLYVGKVYTTGLGNKIYPYFAQWESQVDKYGLPLKSTIYSKDRDKERKKVLIFDPKTLTVIEEKLLPKRETKSTKVDFPIHDELTGFISVWAWRQLPPKASLPLYIKGERSFAQVEFTSKLKCKFKEKETLCQELKVVLPEKSELLKRSKEVIIYFHLDTDLPIEIKGKLPLFGSLKAILKDFSLREAVESF